MQIRKIRLQESGSRVEPRKPKPEWFTIFSGGKNGYDSWCYFSKTSHGWEIWRKEQYSNADKYGFSDILLCVPVEKTGYPYPVGWHVVGE